MRAFGHVQVKFGWFGFRLFAKSLVFGLVERRALRCIFLILLKRFEGLPGSARGWVGKPYETGSVR